jgi:hypothetical protein
MTRRVFGKADQIIPALPEKHTQVLHYYILLTILIFEQLRIASHATKDS